MIAMEGERKVAKVNMDEMAVARWALWNESTEFVPIPVFAAVYRVTPWEHNPIAHAVYTFRLGCVTQARFEDITGIGPELLDKLISGEVWADVYDLGLLAFAAYRIGATQHYAVFSAALARAVANAGAPMAVVSGLVYAETIWQCARVLAWGDKLDSDVVEDCWNAFLVVVDNGLRLIGEDKTVGGTLNSGVFAPGTIVVHRIKERAREEAKAVPQPGVGGEYAEPREDRAKVLRPCGWAEKLAVAHWDTGNVGVVRRIAELHAARLIEGDAAYTRPTALVKTRRRRGRPMGSTGKGNGKGTGKGNGKGKGGA